MLRKIQQHTRSFDRAFMRTSRLQHHRWTVITVFPSPVLHAPDAQSSADANVGRARPSRTIMRTRRRPISCVHRISIVRTRTHAELCCSHWQSGLVWWVRVRVLLVRTIRSPQTYCAAKLDHVRTMRDDFWTQHQCVRSREIQNRHNTTQHNRSTHCI